MNRSDLQTKLHWIFRVAVAAEFIGHGAFGVITKPAWVPYFAVVGIPEPLAYKLMPIVGAVDLTLGIITLFSPRRFILLYISFWGLWTAMLRPLSGEPAWEAVERAANYGVPLAFLLLSGWGKSLRDWFTAIDPRGISRRTINDIVIVLRVTAGLLLLGHGALAALVHKSVFIEQFTTVGLTSIPVQPELLVQLFGWFEILLAVWLLARPTSSLLMFVLMWKVVVESLYPMTGAPVWEFIERGGSYAAPLALYIIMVWRASQVRHLSVYEEWLRTQLARVRSRSHLGYGPTAG